MVRSASGPTVCGAIRKKCAVVPAEVLARGPEELMKPLTLVPSEKAFSPQRLPQAIKRVRVQRAPRASIRSGDGRFWRRMSARLGDMKTVTYGCIHGSGPTERLAIEGNSVTRH